MLSLIWQVLRVHLMKSTCVAAGSWGARLRLDDDVKLTVSAAAVRRVGGASP